MGADPGPYDYKTCGKCGGSGFTGIIIPPKKKCDKCNGSGVIYIHSHK